MAEGLAAAVTGSVNSLDVKGLKVPEGEPHDLGQYYFIVDPTAVSGGAFWDRLNSLSDAVAQQEGARLPGAGRVIPDAVNIEKKVWDLALALAV